VKEREAFLKALAENEDDNVTRSVYADWLDEQGEHEEADRHRKWPAAKAWLVQFCEEHNPFSDVDMEDIEDVEDEWSEYVISYADLIELGREAVKHARRGEMGFSCGPNMEMSEALQDNRHEFWKNWSIVTGIPVSAAQAEKSVFSCAC
jgi:uncharacterized protein (TIGR02996 family)